MAPRFIGKTSLDGVQPLTIGGGSVHGQFARLREILQQAGPEAASLFAEPVVTPASATGPGSVSWYADLPGDAEPLLQMPADRRSGPEARLRQALLRLQPVLADPAAGPLLRRALAVSDEASILAVGGLPLLTDWGLTAQPVGSEEEQAARGSSWTARYLLADRVGVPVAAAAAVPAAAPALPIAPRLAPMATSRSAWDWALAPAALVTAALFLGVGLWAGARMVASRVAERPNAVNLLDERAAREAIDRQREQNTALEREIEARKRLLAGNVCAVDPAQVPRIGPDRGAAVQPNAIVPAPGQPFQGSLADLLTQAVVLIIAPGANGDGTATGSGFFIAPDLIVTNRHVVEEADQQAIMVTSKKLGRTTRVTVVAQTPNSEIGSPDVAVLRVEGVTGIQPLAFSTTAGSLDQVIAAGFPGLLLQSDEAFARLRRGDASAVPEVILTDGRINAIQSSPSGMKIMPHSAAVSGGNSGGPLVDACGRVLGINTFITANREQVVHANYAQKSDGVIAFLKQNSIVATDLTAPCVPGAPATPPASTPPPSTPPPSTLPPSTPPPSTPPIAPSAAAPSPIAPPAATSPPPPAPPPPGPSNSPTPTPATPLVKPPAAPAEPR